MSHFLGPFLDSKNIFSVPIFSFHFSVLSISANDGDSLTFLHRHSLKAPCLADAIDLCSHHSQEGCHSKAFFAPRSLLLPSTHPQPPKRVGCCTFTGRVYPAVQKHAASWKQWDSKGPVCSVANSISFPSSLELKIRGLESVLFLLQCHVLGCQHSSGAKMSFGVEMNGIYVFLGDSSQGGIWKNSVTTNNFHQPSMGEQAK